MNQRIDAERYLKDLLQFTSDLSKEVLPSNFRYEVGLSNGEVHVELQGPRLGTFLFVVGGEIAVVKYDGEYRGFVGLGYEVDEVRVFLRDAFADLVRLIESEQNLFEGKTLIFRKRYFRVQLGGYYVALTK